MFTCKQVSETLAKEDYHKLPLYKKIGIKIHISLCAVCGKFNKQVIVMQDTCNEFKKQEDCCSKHKHSMDDDVKKRMQESLFGKEKKSEEA